MFETHVLLTGTDPVWDSVLTSSRISRWDIDF